MKTHELSIFIPFREEKKDSNVLIAREEAGLSEYYYMDIDGSKISKIEDIMSFMSQKNYHAIEALPPLEMLLFIKKAFNTFLKTADEESKELLLSLFKDKENQVKNRQSI